MFDKVLIANRGEIAVRIVRACRMLGVKTVAVHSAQDRDSAAVRMADEAVCIGPGPARGSYLNMLAILEVARMTGAEAIHPGYGFLAEDADFAEACETEGVTFIGPPSKVVARLGDKTEARDAMRAVGLPMLPGSVGPVATVEEAKALAADIGCPVIVKAAAGGGGRGMQVISDPAHLAWRFLETRGVALKLFHDDRVFLERYLPTSRHVEVQILADGYGNVLHLGERDCSVQRRYQKMVEEAPAPGLPEGLAGRMAAAAVAGARAVGYVGAGTFEFLLAADGSFSFMEVNCRLQVEHPVTEMITGMDLVQEQIRIAAGEPLLYAQHDVTPRGVAIECRINAEDPTRDFAPTAGTLDRFEPPGGPFVRVDTHGYPGYRVPAFYDSLLAKLVVWAPDRDAAIERMRVALDEFRVAGKGVRTTVSFLSQVIDHPRFREARHDTGLVAELLRDDLG